VNTLDHSIVIGTGTLITKCQPADSNVTGTCNLTVAPGYKPQLAACFNKSSTLLKLDRDSQPRIKGASADLGCYEVQ